MNQKQTNIMDTNEDEEIKAKVLRRDEQETRVLALQAIPCGYRPAESVRARDVLGYILGRLMSLREFGRCDWQLIEKAAAKLVVKFHDELCAF